MSIAACGGSDDEEDGSWSYKYGKLNVNGKDYACYGLYMPITYSSTWEDNTLSIRLPLGELSDAQKGEYDYDYMYVITCSGGRKPSTGTDLSNYNDVSVWYSGNALYSDDSYYESGSAVVKEVYDGGITIEFKDFSFSGDNTYVFNGTVKLDYDID